MLQAKRFRAFVVFCFEMTSRRKSSCKRKNHQNFSLKAYLDDNMIDPVMWKERLPDSLFLVIIYGCHHRY